MTREAYFWHGMVAVREARHATVYTAFKTRNGIRIRRGIGRTVWLSVLAD
jgi:hypothetical protein